MNNYDAFILQFRKDAEAATAKLNQIKAHYDRIDTVLTKLERKLVKV